MNIMVAVAVADCKLYIIEEFLRRLDVEIAELEKFGGCHVLMYGDSLEKDGYVWNKLSPWLKEHKEKVSYLQGKLSRPDNDNIYNSFVVAQAREYLRKAALQVKDWDVMFFWDVDVIPDTGAGVKLAGAMADAGNCDIVGAVVADWSSEVPSIGHFDENDPELKLIFHNWKEELKPNEMYNVGVTHLACTLVKREVLEKITFLCDENTLRWGDDGYFGRLAYKQGYRTGVYTGVGALHVHESMKGVRTEIRRDGVLTTVLYVVPHKVVDEAGKEPALAYVRDNAGGHFPAPIDWTFLRGQPVPERLLGRERVEMLLQGSAFRRIIINRKDAKIASGLF